MVGCYGLNSYHLPRVPRDCFVEANPRIDVWELHQSGALVDGTTTELRWGGHGGVPARRIARPMFGSVKPACWWSGTNPWRVSAGHGSSVRFVVDDLDICTCAIRSPVGDVTGCDTWLRTCNRRPAS